MPTPLELLLDPISLTCLAVYALLMAVERLFPARALPRQPLWLLRGLTSFAVYFFLSSYLPMWWDAYLAPLQLFDLTGLGVLEGTVVGLLVFELGTYGYHRAVHSSHRLWRWVHQMHHSAERLDTAGAFWFSPLDMVGWTLLGSLMLVLGVGVAPAAATNVLLITFALAVFQHMNVRTPRWLGVLVQRPESHALHHARGVHRFNYADLPVFDMLFGTFRNPATFADEIGFADGDSLRVVDMLLGRDVAATPRVQQPARQAPHSASITRPAASDIHAALPTK